jgi:hypothetical protein
MSEELLNENDKNAGDGVTAPGGAGASATGRLRRPSAPPGSPTSSWAFSLNPFSRSSDTTNFSQASTLAVWEEAFHPLSSAIQAARPC